MFRRSHPLSTFTWLAGAAVGVACSIPDYGARQTPEGDGEGGENVGGVSGQSASGGAAGAGNGTNGGSAGNSTRGGTAGDSGGTSSGSGGAGDGGASGSNGGDAGSGDAGKGGAGSGGAAGKGGAGSGGAGNTGGAGSGGAAGKGGAGSGGAAGKGGAGSGGAGNTGGAGSGGAAGKGGAGNGGGGSGGGPLCITPNSSNLVPNPGFDTSSVSHFVSFDSFITLSRSTLDATACASSGSLIVTNSHPDGLNSGAIHCITTISPGTTYNVGGWMMEPSGFAQGQVFLQFIFTDGPDCTGSFVGDVTSLEGPSLSSPFDTWRSVRADGLVAPTGAVSFGVHVKAIKNFPNALAYRAHFDMLYATPAPGEF